MNTPQPNSSGSLHPACSLRAFVLPRGVQYENLQKVTVTKGRATHIASPWVEGFTLCGWRWWFHCDLGTDYYCQRCQAKLAKIKAANDFGSGNGEPQAST